MISAFVGSSTNVSGSSSATAIAEPRPGQHPDRRPEHRADQHEQQADGAEDVPEPADQVGQLLHVSEPPDEAGGQGDAEQPAEHDLDDRRQREPRQQAGRYLRLPSAIATR
jgi:hypothetical protein